MRKRDTAESILGQKSGPALAVLPDRRRRPCICGVVGFLPILQLVFGPFLSFECFVWYKNSKWLRHTPPVVAKGFNMLILLQTRFWF